jgi:hypothetical protein
MPLWIEGTAVLKYPKCKWGHTWETSRIEKCIDSRGHWFSANCDVLAEGYVHCSQCGEPKVTR